jgi:hypothetical protein
MTHYTADDFRNPSNFRTEYDSAAGGAEAYAKGRRIGAKAQEVTIAINDTWGATSDNGGHITSYQRIGYHADTAELLRGILDSGCKLAVYRDNGRGITRAELAAGRPQELAAA